MSSPSHICASVLAFPSHGTWLCPRIGPPWLFGLCIPPFFSLAVVFSVSTPLFFAFFFCSSTLLLSCITCLSPLHSECLSYRSATFVGCLSRLAFGYTLHRRSAPTLLFSRSCFGFSALSLLALSLARWNGIGQSLLGRQGTSLLRCRMNS